MSANAHSTNNKPSREAEFSNALWKLDRDWKEQADAQSKPRPDRLFLFALVAPLLYVLSMAPVALILRLAAFPYKCVVAFKYFYYPIIWVLQGHTSVAILVGVSWIGYAVVFRLVSRR
ncbi:MAG: hypothetical protein WCQ21_26470 [Verrucomicrobiota bacterium]